MDLTNPSEVVKSRLCEHGPPSGRTANSTTDASGRRSNICTATSCGRLIARLNMPLGTIAEVQAARGIAPWIRWGAGFATSFSDPILIRRIGGISVVVSPAEPDRFMESVRTALAAGTV